MTYYSEDQIKRIVEAAAKRLGSNPTTMEVRNIVRQVLETFENSPGSEISLPASSSASEAAGGESSRVILTAFGKNHPGVISSITKVLADFQCDIQDMTQKLMQEFYSLMIIFDMTGSSASFDVIREKILEAGNEVGAKCLIQHEDIFKGMHRI
jgi:ACT domain-containing protein